MKKLEAELRRYANSDIYPFHMPGHKGRGDEVHQIDITEIDGFDNLHDPKDLIYGEMCAAAEFYGTKRTFFSVNGSTCAILSAISAAVPFKGTLLIERGCHISVYHAAYLRHLHLLYIDDILNQMQMTDRKDRQEAWEKVKLPVQPDAVMITSPSYEGCVKNVAFWAEFAHRQDIPLLVDEAHGAHFSMHAYFPKSSIFQGADIVIQSVHKTLPAMTQTALLHNVTGKVSSEKIEEFLDIYETSSPSYVLMASITSCLHLVMDPNEDLFERYAGRLKKLRKHLDSMKHLKLMGGKECVLKRDEFPPYEEGVRTDPGKICILTGKSGMTGTELYDLVREKYRLQPEMKTPDSVLFMTSIYDTEEGFERLEDALLEIDGEAEQKKKNPRINQKERKKTESRPSLPQCVCTIAEAMDQGESEKIDLKEAEGRISAGYIIVFPPDAPLLVPGEQFDRSVLDEIQRDSAAGLSLNGITDGKVAVLKKSCMH